MWSTTTALGGLLLAVPALVSAAPVAQISHPIPWSRATIQENIELSIGKAKRMEAGAMMGDANFPDPCIYKLGNTWYAFATTGGGKNIQMASSTDFTSWSMLGGDALPTVPAWVDQGTPATWAPDIQQVDDGSFVLYYAAASASDPSKHCVGAATSGSITGPYTGQASPMFCPLSQGGAIDPSSFVDSGGQRYVLYKIDGNSIGHGGDCNNNVAPYVATPILLQAVEGDGITQQGNPVELLNNNGASDTGIVEAPSLVKAPNNIYYLFFSSGCYSTPGYTVNYATANSVDGPYTRASRPLFETGDDGLTSPGGADTWNDGQHLVFHAGPASDRGLYVATYSTNGNVLSA